MLFSSSFLVSRQLIFLVSPHRDFSITIYYFLEQLGGGERRKRRFFVCLFFKQKKKVKILQRQFVSWENFVGRSYLLTGMCQGCGDGAGCSQATVIILKLQHFLVLCGPLVLSSTAYK